jgi:hypothetical protein
MPYRRPSVVNLNSVAGFHPRKALQTFIFLLPNVVFDWLMLNLTIALLRFIEVSTSLFRLLSIALIGLLAVIIKPFIVVPMALVLESALQFAGITSVIQSAFDMIFGQPPTVPPPSCVECVFDEWFFDVFKVFFAVMLTASKLFRPIVKPLLSWLLYRFQESEKGVLTIIAAGGGTAAKLIQQAAKLYL